MSLTYAMQAELPANVPVYSCRSSTALLMQGAGANGPITVPYKMVSMKHRKEPEDKKNTLHVLNLQPLTIDKVNIALFTVFIVHG